VELLSLANENVDAYDLASEGLGETVLYCESVSSW